MNLIELERALRQLRLGGIAAVLETRLHQAQAEAMAPIDLISSLVADELTSDTGTKEASGHVCVELRSVPLSHSLCEESNTGGHIV